MRFLLLDNGLRQHAGHHNHFADAFQRAAAAQGHEVIIYADKQIGGRLKAELQAHPLFDAYLYDSPPDDPLSGSLRQFLKHHRQMLKDLQSVGDQFADDDVLLLPTAEPALLAAVGLWRQIAQRPLKTAAMFHRMDEPWGAGTVASALHRTCIRPFEKEMASNLWIGATNQALAERLAPVFGRDEIPVRPTLYTFVAPAEPRLRAPRDPVVIGFVGAPREEKGARQINAIVRTARQRAASPYEFVVQAHGVKELGAAGKNPPPHIRILPDWLDEDAFAAMLCSLDMVVLPYDRQAYEARISGALPLASGYGRPMVAPNGTWIEKQIAAGLAVGVCYQGDGPDAVVDAIERLAAGLPEFQAAAMHAAPRARQVFAVDSLVGELASWARPEVKPAKPTKPARTAKPTTRRRKARP